MKKLFLALLLLSPQCWGAVALVAGQTVSGHTNAGALTVMLTNNPTAGNFVVVGVSITSTFTATVADGAATPNVYTATTNSPSTNSTAGTRTYIFYLANAPASANKSIVITPNTGGPALDAWAGEFSGVITTTPLEIDAAHSAATSQASINDPSVITTTDGDLMIGVAGANQTISVAGTPWTLLSTVQNGNAAEYYIQPSHAAQAIAFTQGVCGSCQWSAMNAAFKPAAGATKKCTITLMGVGPC